MQALILAGGAGTRLRPLTSTMPKPVLPLANRPHIAYVIDWLEWHGVDDVVVSCGHLADGVRAALEGFTRIPVRFAEEPDARGTAGAIKFCEEMLAERFLVLNGDVLCDLDLSAQISQHERTGARATIALYPVEDPTAYGLVRRADEGEVAEFLEKPDPAEIDTDEINAGAYVLEREVLALVPAGKEVSIEREVFPLLVGDGLYGKRLEGYWIDIGTPDRFLQANWDILEGRVTTIVSEELHSSEPLVGVGAEVDPAASVGPRAVLGPACTVGADALISESVLLEGCVVGAGARLRGAILAAGVEVAPGAEVDGEVIGEGETVGAPA
ncbi:MAG: sugar phosphate nucleotidyltransferase [Solirubrobacterales bacterium]